jgi:predicted RNA-binding Zn ribbon-like protein
VEREALLSGLVHPGGREPAPAPLRLVQGFVNTVDREHGPDLFADAEGLAEWLGRQGFADSVEAGDRDAARSAREALRSLLWANNGEPYDAAAADVLAGAARRARLEPTFTPGAAALVPRAGGVEGAIGQVLAIAFAAMLDGTWRRLKACPGHRCGWAFYDRSTNASATWCSMQVCGGRAKAGAYYRRRRGA